MKTPKGWVRNDTNGNTTGFRRGVGGIMLLTVWSANGKWWGCVNSGSSSGTGLKDRDEVIDRVERKALKQLDKIAAKLRAEINELSRTAYLRSKP